MKVKASILKKVLIKLSDKTGKGLDHSGLKEISEMIPGLSGDYLYKKILQEVKQMQDNDLHGVGQFQFNSILDFLGFKTMDKFIASLESPIDDQLQSLEGSYYSYVRANHPEGRVLRSPVRISLDEEIAYFELRGKDQRFKGPVRMKDGILFILMVAESGKCFHHVYKIGNRKAPKVLQGVFSGVSTAPDPIGGRALLIRQDLPFENLSNKKEDVKEMMDSAILEESRVGGYFKDYNNNNVSPLKSSDFGYDDLIQ